MTIDDEIFADLLEKVEGGVPLRAACQDQGVPDIVVLQKYLRRNPELMARLRAARQAAKEKAAGDEAFARQVRDNRSQFIEGQRNA